MIVLYHCVAARSFRPLWALEELGLPYQLNMLAFPPRVASRDYLQQNPLGTVPLLVDGAVRMTESAAICHYLGEKHGPSDLVVRPEEADFGAFLNWLHFGEATLTFPQTIVLRYERFEPAGRKLPQAVADYRRWFLGRLRTLEPILAVRSDMCAGRFTMADISIGYALLLAAHLGFEPEFPPAVRDYWLRLRERPAFLRARAAETAAANAQGVSPVPAPLLEP
ncbi:glutathione S-transferase family protein [Pseudoduganella namucuonensis]|uniref:Glutathione S-transferase n=1 Tax=Pseudoduganella namucuonensis TaxID=1035707 RepID=A0A1I7LPK4_9BURK|nr:glutathione S-transferase family protein [Pseudoduganella namucuonensis]SFV11647.1 Glutathione S-transferase [Pseudoduganella namucuonensis]